MSVVVNVVGEDRCRAAAGGVTEFLHGLGKTRGEAPLNRGNRPNFSAEFSRAYRSLQGAPEVESEA